MFKGKINRIPVYANRYSNYLSYEQVKRNTKECANIPGFGVVFIFIIIKIYNCKGIVSYARPVTVTRFLITNRYMTITVKKWHTRRLIMSYCAF